MFESILYPSARISHNLRDVRDRDQEGRARRTALLVSKTPGEVSIKGADAIVRTFKTADVETLMRRRYR